MYADNPNSDSNGQVRAETRAGTLKNENKFREFEKALSDLADGKDLSREVAAHAMENLLGDKLKKIPDSQIAAFIMGLRTKGETTEEVAGLLDAVANAGDKIVLDNPSEILDTCGTGGDEHATFNISTISGLIAASGGVKVVKHGNSAISSSSGSADILNALGVNIHLSPPGVANCVKTVGFGFCFARYFHPAFGRVAKVRKELGGRTIFNVLGPMSNPAGAGRHLLGVSSPDMCELVADVLLERGATRALIFCGTSPDGCLDEISIFGKTQIIEIKNGEKLKYEIDPEDFSIGRENSIKKIQVQSVKEAALAAREVIIERKSGPKLEIAALNAGGALYISGKADSIKEGYEMARNLLLDESTAKLLHELVQKSNSLKNHKKAPVTPGIETEQLISGMNAAFSISKGNLLKHDIPRELNPILKKGQQLQKTDYEKMRNLIETNPEFRANLYECDRGIITEENLHKNIGYLWLVRPVDWEKKVEKILGEADEQGRQQSKGQNLEKAKKENQILKKENLKVHNKLETEKEKNKKNIKEHDKAKSNLKEEIAGLTGELETIQENSIKMEEKLKLEEFEHSQVKKELSESHNELEKYKKIALDAKSLCTDVLNRIENSKEKEKIERNLKKQQKLYESLQKVRKSPQKPLKVPDGLLSTSKPAAEVLVKHPQAWLLIDGYNVILRTVPDLNLLPKDELAIKREELVSRTTNIIDRYQIEHARVFWDSEYGTEARSGGNTSQGHRVTESYVENADDGLVEFSRREENPVIMVTEDNGIKERVKKYKVNHLSHEQFEFLAKKASGIS